MLEIAKFKNDSGEEIAITRDDVRNTICPNADDKEISMFLALCQAQKLNPFVKDAYLVKYRDNPASIITSKDAFMKRAYANPKFKGLQAGVTVLSGGHIVRREGSAVFKAAKEILVGGWAKVFIDGREPSFDEVALDEYNAGRAQWIKMPGTMIRKVAIVHAIREAFPDQFQGLYTAEEMQQAGNGDYEQPTQAAQPVEVEAVEVEAEASDERVAEIMDMVSKFAALCGKTEAEALDAVLGSRAAKSAGIDDSGSFTVSQADVLDELLDAWIEKAEIRAAEQTDEEPAAVELPDNLKEVAAHIGATFTEEK